MNLILIRCLSLTVMIIIKSPLFKLKTNFTGYWIMKI